MLYSAASILACAAAALAQTAGFDAITTPASGSSIAAGSTFEIDWDATTHLTDTVSIVLLGGATPGTLQPLSTIASGIVNSVAKFSWSVPATLGADATYGFKIQLDSDPTTFQYSFPFSITGGEAVSSSSSASASASASGSASNSGSSSGSSSTTSASASTSASPSTTAPASTTAVASATVTMSSFTGNLSTTGAPAKTTVTSVVVASASKTASGSASVSTGAASQMGASAAALLGGLALAVLAL